MKSLLLSLVLLLMSASTLASTVTVMSYNIRCGSCEPVDNINHWKKRKYFVAHLISSHNPDVIGLQEAELFQIEDLVEMLDDYSWIGVGRDDGKDKGETTAILFRTARFSLRGQQTLWLSPTPMQPSRGWDAAYRRTLSIAKLLDARSKQSFYVFNTHLDNEGEMARQEGSKLLLNELAKIDSTVPLVVTGDFNFTSDSIGYGLMSQALADAEKISAAPAEGGRKTFNGFSENGGADNGAGDKEADHRIDFVFVKKSMKVHSHKVDTTTYKNLFPSDHYPIITVIDTAWTNEATAELTATH